MQVGICSFSSLSGASRHNFLLRIEKETTCLSSLLLDAQGILRTSQSYLNYTRFCNSTNLPGIGTVFWIQSLLKSEAEGFGLLILFVQGLIVIIQFR